MNFASINWLAVVVCVLVTIVSGSLWYNPKTFFPVWWAGVRTSPDKKPGEGQNMGLVFGMLVQVWHIAILILLKKSPDKKVLL